MKFGPATFGELNADDYDALHDPGTTQESVALIQEIAAGGRVLELAIGTGRMSIPLAENGLEISGIEGSPDMVEKLREKPGGKNIPVVIGDIADVEIEGPFDHVFLVFNTLFNLTSQEAQVRCFRNVARRLREGGTFLVETFVPDAEHIRSGQWIRTMKVDFSSVWIEAAQHDPIAQTFDFQRIRIAESGLRLVPLVMRYAFPPEMDLMAQLAGLRLKNRWGGWRREPFTADSKMHVSLYEKPV
jgi:SAM-dependent methyltransferase